MSIEQTDQNFNRELNIMIQIAQWLQSSQLTISSEKLVCFLQNIIGKLTHQK